MHGVPKVEGIFNTKAFHLEKGNMCEAFLFVNISWCSMLASLVTPHTTKSVLIHEFVVYI